MQRSRRPHTHAYSQFKVCRNINTIIESAHAWTNTTKCWWLCMLWSIVNCRFRIANDECEIGSCVELKKPMRQMILCVCHVVRHVNVDLSVWNDDLMCSHHLYAFIRLDEFICYVFGSTTKILCFSFHRVPFFHIFALIRSSAVLLCVPQMAAVTTRIVNSLQQHREDNGSRNSSSNK